MDKRKENTIKKVQEKIELQVNERNKVMNLLSEIPIHEKTMEMQIEHIEDMKVQEKSGVIRQRDKFGNVLDKLDMPKTITVYEIDLIRMKNHLITMMEELFFLLRGRKPEEVRNQLTGHYALIYDEYKKIKKILGDSNVVRPKIDNSRD